MIRYRHIVPVIAPPAISFLFPQNAIHIIQRLFL